MPGSSVFHQGEITSRGHTCKSDAMVNDTSIPRHLNTSQLRKMECGEQMGDRSAGACYLVAGSGTIRCSSVSHTFSRRQRRMSRGLRLVTFGFCSSGIAFSTSGRR